MKDDTNTSHRSTTNDRSFLRINSAVFIELTEIIEIDLKHGNCDQQIWSLKWVETFFSLQAAIIYKLVRFAQLFAIYDTLITSDQLIDAENSLGSFGIWDDFKLVSDKNLAVLASWTKEKMN